MKKKTPVILLIIFLVAGGASLSLYFFNFLGQSKFTEEIVSNNADKLKIELKSFLKTAQNNIRHFKNDIKKQSSDSMNIQSLNQYFSEVLKKNKLISAVVLSGNNKQYILVKEDNSWISTFDNELKDSLTTWHRYDDNYSEISSWVDTYSFVFQENTIIELLKNRGSDKALWQVIERSTREREDLAIHVTTVSTKKDSNYVFAFVYSIKSIEERLSFQTGESNMLLTLIGDETDVYFPFSVDLQLTDSSGITLKTSVTKIVENWKNNGGGKPQLFSFPFAEREYWTRIDTLINEQDVSAFAYSVKESDLKKMEKDQDLKYVYLAGLFFLLSIIVAFIIKRSDKNGGAEKLPQLTSLGPSEIASILKEGETGNIEFKSSLRWDYREEKVNPSLENVILKTIAAFTNAEGGYLIIGVDDDGKVLGLENDYNSFKKQNLDYFELHIRKIINNQFGIAYGQSVLNIEFPEINGLNICVITINPAEKPKFLTIKNKQGQMVEKFYVRTGNSSQEITSLEEINEYMKRRF
ncbi:MAG: hypothetical protein DRI54_05425 [Bacteroidetes bacterium]|nr:MAG: hypothetical protein DRI54_05425 [Bacteroidota bacterium]